MGQAMSCRPGCSPTRCCPPSMPFRGHWCRSVKSTSKPHLQSACFPWLGLAPSVPRVLACNTLFCTGKFEGVLGSGLAPAVPAPRKSGALCGAWWEGAGGPVFSRSRAQVPRYLAKPEPASDAPLTHSARLRATRVNPTLDIPGRVPFCGMPLGSMVGLSWRAGVSPLCYVRRWSSQGPARTQSATGARGAPGLSQAWQMAGHRGMERRADHCWPGWAHRGDHGVAVVCVAPFLTRLGQALAGAAA